MEKIFKSKIKKFIFRNKLFSLLLLFNILYFSSQVNWYHVLHDSKHAVGYILGQIGIEKYKHYTIKKSKEPLVIYFDKEKSTIINPRVDIWDLNSYKHIDMDNSLILPPRIYKWGGKLYNLTNEGCYYLVDFKKEISRYVIIYKKDVLSLMSSISWLVTHGNKDEFKSFSEKIKKLKTKKLSLTCGPVSTFASKLLNKYHIENRIINFLTIDQWNTYDNGHVLIEVKINHRYVLFDLDNNLYFGLRGKKLKAKDFLDKIDFNLLKFRKLSKDSYVDTNGFYYNKINYIGFADYINNHIRKWYQRVMQVPIIIKNGIYYVGLNNKKYKDNILKYIPNAIILNKDEFFKKFYRGKQ